MTRYTGKTRKTCETCATTKGLRLGKGYEGVVVEGTGSLVAKLHAPSRLCQSVGRFAGWRKECHRGALSTAPTRGFDDSTTAEQQQSSSRAASSWKSDGASQAQAAQQLGWATVAGGGSGSIAKPCKAVELCSFAEAGESAKDVCVVGKTDIRERPAAPSLWLGMIATYKAHDWTRLPPLANGDGYSNEGTYTTTGSGCAGRLASSQQEKGPASSILAHSRFMTQQRRSL